MGNRWDVHWKDYYQILQVHPTAGQEVIKAAYDRLAKKYHPDVNQEPSSTQKMKDVNEAFEVLGTLETRRLYHPEWLQKRRESNNRQAPPRASARGGTYEPPGTYEHHETPARPTNFKPRIPAWGKWSIGLAVGLFVIAVVAVVVLNLTSSSQTPTTKIYQAPTTKSNLFPDVKIQSVTLPSNVRVSSGDLKYNHTFRVVNSESVDVTVKWQGDSSITGIFDSGSITVPKNSYRDVTRSYYYITSGTERLTYTLYYDGILLDTWSGTHYITQSSASVSLPTGTYLVKKLVGGYGELKIDNGLDLDSVALLSRIEAPEIPLMAVYIRAGASHTITGISDGIYVFYFSCGEDWDVDSKKFMRKAIYQRFKDDFYFNTTSDQYMTWDVTLNPVIGGTAEAEYLGEGEFPVLD